MKLLKADTKTAENVMKCLPSSTVIETLDTAELISKPPETSAVVLASF